MSAMEFYIKKSSRDSGVKLVLGIGKPKWNLLTKKSYCYKGKKHSWRDGQLRLISDLFLRFLLKTDDVGNEHSSVMNH